jgi:zinc D-Ala-D-Ala carboxypeptidase
VATTYFEETWPKDRWPSFSFREIACRETGECVIDEGMMDALQNVRNAVGPLVITSGYRSPRHSIEAEKIDKTGLAGAHTLGKAVDVQCRGGEALQILNLALGYGFTGIGVSQKGDNRFLHLDTIVPEDDFHVPRPTIWSY